MNRSNAAGGSPAPASAGAALVTVRGPAATLSKAQKEFNRLSAQIQRERERLNAWEAYVPRYAERMHGQLQPAIDAVRKAQRDLVRRIDLLLDQRVVQPPLSRRRRSKLQSLLASVVQDLLVEGADPEMEALHDKHSEFSNQELRQRELEHVETMAASLLGADAVKDHGADNADDLFAHIDEQLSAQAAAEQGRREAAAAARAAKRGRPGRAEIDAERRARAAREASASVREIFRKLASSLHPDREPDPAERERKTLLMQRANQAYERDDVIALLGLQLEIEQIGVDHLATLPETRIKHYNEVLREQVLAIQRKIAAFELQFGNEVGEGIRTPDPNAVDRALSQRIAQAKALRKSIERDIVDLGDSRRRGALIDSLEDEADDFDALDQEAFEAIFDLGPGPVGRRRRGR